VGIIELHEEYFGVKGFIRDEQRSETGGHRLEQKVLEGQQTKESAIQHQTAHVIEENKS